MFTRSMYSLDALGRRAYPERVYVTDGPPHPHGAGFHAWRRAADALCYADGYYVWRVEAGGELATSRCGGKVACTRLRVLWGYDATELLTRFALEVGRDVVHLWPSAPLAVRGFFRTGRRIDEARACAHGNTDWPGTRRDIAARAACRRALDAAHPIVAEHAALLTIAMQYAAEALAIEESDTWSSIQAHRQAYRTRLELRITAEAERLNLTTIPGSPTSRPHHRN